MEPAAVPAAASALAGPNQGAKKPCCNHNQHAHAHAHPAAAGGPPHPAAGAMPLPPVPDAMKAALGLPTLTDLQQMSPEELKELKGALQQRLARQLQQHQMQQQHANGNGAMGPMVLPPAATMAAAAAAAGVGVGSNGSGAVAAGMPGAAVGANGTRAALPAAATAVTGGMVVAGANGGQPPSAEPPSPAPGGPEGADEGKNGGAGGMDIFEAVKMGLASVVRRMVQEQETRSGGKEALAAFLGQRDADGHTITHWAAKRGDFALVKFLASKGAPLFEASGDAVGMEPIHWAITEGHLPVLHFLVSKGADINARDKQLCTPLLIAAQYGQAEAAAYLIQAGADTTLLDVNRDSAMHWGAYKGELNIVQLLHHLGLPPDDVDGYGQAPLHLAALRGNLPVVEYLVLDADAQTGRKDKNGATPLDLAVKKQQRRVAAFLRAQALEARFAWRQLLSVQHWRAWLQGGGNAEGSAWPFYLVVLTNLWCHLLFPLRFFSEAGVTALASHGALTTWCVALQLSMWLFFLLAWRTDPGHLNPSAPGARQAYDAALARFTGHGVEAALSEVSAEGLEEGEAGAKLLRRLTRAQQLCHACKVVRPPRSKHCRVCRRCCAVMDHHCPFLGNCVGAGNYRWFVAYVANVLLAIVLFASIACIYLSHVGADLLVILTLAYLVGMGLMVGLLGCYHAQLISANLTTNEHQNFHRYEYFKDANGRLRNPYDAGCARNCLSRLVYAEAPAAHPDAATNGVNGGGGSGGFFGRGSARRRGGGVFESLHGRMGASPLGTVDEGDEEDGLLTVV